MKDIPVKNKEPKTEKTEILIENNTLNIHTIENLKFVCDNSHWAERLKGFEAMSVRLDKGVESRDVKDILPLTTTNIEIFIDLCVSHLGDPHQKVAAESMSVLSTCVEKYTVQTGNKLGVLLTALFYRLADRRGQIKDAANVLLNTTRVSYEPNMIMAALSPRIFEIPERMKTALMQYMGVLVPHCTGYFSVPHNTGAFLGRMANILGCAGSKPSVTLTVAGRRLLALVGKAIPQVMMVQISTLPLQQQLVLKKLLVSSIPDIDLLVAAAGRADWNRASMEREKARNIQQANSQNTYSNNTEKLNEKSLGKSTGLLQDRTSEIPQQYSSGLSPQEKISPKSNIKELKIETYNQNKADFPSLSLAMFPENRFFLDPSPLNEYGTPPDTPPAPPGRHICIHMYLYTHT
jgi:hypothetical protein